MVVDNGLPEVEMTLGPSRVMEELVDLDDDDPVWDSAAEKSQARLRWRRLAWTERRTSARLRLSRNG